jgi:hypothetical protein
VAQGQLATRECHAAQLDATYPLGQCRLTVMVDGPPIPTKLRAATRAYEAAINNLTQAAGLAA